MKGCPALDGPIRGRFDRASRAAVAGGALWVAAGCASAPAVDVSVDPAGRWIPVELSPACVPVVDGTIDGRAAALVLDTGVSVTLVDSTWAVAAGMETEGGYAVDAPGGTRDVRSGETVDLAFDGVALRRVRPLVLDLSWFEWYFGRRPVVVVGSELFENAVVDIDYRNHRVAVRAPESPPRMDSEVATLILSPADSRGLREVTGEIAGSAFRLELDTGSNGNLTIDLEAAARAGVEPDPDAREAVTVGVAGEVRESIARVDSIVLAGIAVADVPARLAAPRPGDGAGTIGCGVLRRFRAILDYPRERLHLIAAPGWRDVPFVENRSGLVPGPHPGGIEVVSVMEDEAAELAGLRPGDVITAVDGRPIDDLEGSPVAWIYGPEGATVDLELSNGESLTLVLR